MIELHGTRQFTVPCDRLYNEFTDLNNLVKSLPDVKSIKELSNNHAVIVVSPSLSFVKGELETTIRKVSENPPLEAEMEITSKGIGTSIKLNTSFTLAATDTGSDLYWEAEVKELGGLLKLVPASLLKGAAQKVIDGWFNSLEQRLVD